MFICWRRKWQQNRTLGNLHSNAFLVLGRRRFDCLDCARSELNKQGISESSRIGIGNGRDDNDVRLRCWDVWMIRTSWDNIFELLDYLILGIPCWNMLFIHKYSRISWSSNFLKIVPKYEKSPPYFKTSSVSFQVENDKMIICNTFIFACLSLV